MDALQNDDRVGDVVREAVLEWKIEDNASDEIPDDYRKYIWRKWAFVIICLAVTLIVVGVALTIGETPISFIETYSTIFHHLIGDIQNKLYDYTIIEIRMPRVIIGILAGAGLAICGTVMQSVMMNPLADPYTTGVSSGALFGVTVAMVLGFGLADGQLGIFVNAFVFSLIPTAVIVIISKMRNVSPTVMVMAGIAVMYIFNAMTTVLKLWTDPDTLSEIYVWSVGSLTFAGWSAVPYMLAVIIPGMIIMMLLSRKINVLTTGDENAIAMGINVNALRRFLLIVIAVVTAVVVSFTGLIGFVGLVAPHICRIFVGADNRYLIPASAMFGAMLLVLADLIGRTIIAPSVLQVGVITSFIGGPMFLWLILRKNSRVW